MNTGISFGKELYEKENKNNHYFAYHVAFVFFNPFWSSLSSGACCSY